MTEYFTALSPVERSFPCPEISISKAFWQPNLDSLLQKIGKLQSLKQLKYFHSLTENYCFFDLLQLLKSLSKIFKLNFTDFLTSLK